MVHNNIYSLPLVIASTIVRVLVGWGASSGPTTKDGFTTTRSIPLSSATLHASFSAMVFAYAYQSYIQESKRQTAVIIHTFSCIYIYIYNGLFGRCCYIIVFTVLYVGPV